MKFRYLIPFFLLPLAWGQAPTTVTATVVGQNGVPYVHGTVTATLVDSTGHDLSASPVLVGTIPITFGQQQANFDSTATFTLSLMPASGISTPSGTQWNFKICSQNPVGQPPNTFVPVMQCFAYTFTVVSPGPMNLSSALSAVAPPIAVPGVGVFVPLGGGVMTGPLTTPSLSIGSGGNLVTMAPHTTPLAGWTFDTFSPDTACASVNCISSTSTSAQTVSGPLSAIGVGTIAANFLATTGASGTVWGVTGGVQGWITGGGSATLPPATDINDTIQVNGSGTPTILIPASTGTWEAVQNGGAIAGGADISTLLSTKINTLCASSTPVRVHIAAGAFSINSGVLINATSSTCKGLVIEGDGANNTILTTNCSGAGYGIWYNNTSGGGAEHNQGPTIRNLQIQGTGGAACTTGIRVTQSSEFLIDNAVITGFSGQTYTAGTISTSGTAVTGVGTIFTSAMVHGFIEKTTGTATTRAQICTFTNATTMGLCSAGFPGGDLAPGTAYALAYGGDGIALDPGSGYVQYGSIKESYLPGNLVGINAWGSTTGGASRISVTGKRNYIAPNPGARITDSVGIYLGKGSDTFQIEAPSNNETVCYVLESSHGNQINGECENSGSFAPVTTCNGGVASQNCTQAVEVSSDTNGHGWNNQFGLYAYLVGTVYRFDNSTGAFNARIAGDRTLAGQFTTHYDLYGTAGCPSVTSAAPLTIATYDCLYSSAVIAPVSITISSFAAAPNACYGNTGTLNTPSTTTMTGLTTAMAPRWSFATDPRTLVGWGSTGGMVLNLWPTANTLNSEVCNVTASSITTSAVTFNVEP